MFRLHWLILYMKCNLRDAHKLFDVMTIWNISSWNALVARYLKDWEFYFSEDLFSRMLCRNVTFCVYLRERGCLQRENGETIYLFPNSITKREISQLRSGLRWFCSVGDHIEMEFLSACKKRSGGGIRGGIQWHVKDRITQVSFLRLI